MDKKATHETRLVGLEYSAEWALYMVREVSRRREHLEGEMRAVKTYFEEAGENLKATNAGLALGRMTMAKDSIAGLINDLEVFAGLADQLREEAP